VDDDWELRRHTAVEETATAPGRRWRSPGVGERVGRPDDRLTDAPSATPCTFKTTNRI